MRPRNALERRVDKLAASVKDLTPAQREWGLSHIIPHRCIYRTRSHKCTCVNCGYTWKEDTPKRCPHCGARLTLEKDTRQRRFVERKYYGIVQKVREFTVIRTFLIYDNRKLGEQPYTTFTELFQHWIGEDGSDTIRARNIAMFPYYRECPFSLCSDLSIKDDRTPYGYRKDCYHFTPDGVYPRMKHFEILSRNGFKGDFLGFNPEDVFCCLLTDNRFETLWKCERYDIAKYYIYKDKGRVISRWKQVLQLHRTGYVVRSLGIWLDYLDLLEYFHKDVNSPKYLFPEDLDAEHDRLMEKKREILEREELERRKREEKEKLAILASKSPYFGITFGNSRIFVMVLKTLEDYKREGDLQHHCVYTNSYYGKKDSLVLSARMKDAPDKPVETVEISLKTGKILQCFGACNRFTEHHEEIKKLVNKHSYKFIRS